MAERAEHTPGAAPEPLTHPVLGTWTPALDQQTGGLVWVEEVTPGTEAHTRLMAAAPGLLAALKAIMHMEATSPLEACAYQGPPPKKWMREVAPALEARYNAVREAQAIAKPAIEAAEQ